MGRTITAYSMIIEQVMMRWRNYRKALRIQDRECFDKLIQVAKYQVQAGVMAQNPNAFDSMSMAMLIDLQKQINVLEENAKKIENEILQLYEKK